jgi:tetratricopeptide (TPR) repeat protein
VQKLLVARLAHSTSRHALAEIADLSIRLAEHAFSFRDLETLKQASLVLNSLPISGAREVGAYYQALAIKQRRQWHIAKPTLEALVNEVPLAYRGRVIQSLGALSLSAGDFEEALQLQLKALRAVQQANNDDLITVLRARINISTIRSVAGYHQEALRDLKAVAPLVRTVAAEHPFWFYLYHNELAFELSEVGRLDEAGAALAVALSSPFAAAYPEWSATRNELEEKSTRLAQPLVALSSLTTTSKALSISTSAAASAELISTPSSRQPSLEARRSERRHPQPRVARLAARLRYRMRAERLRVLTRSAAASTPDANRSARGCCSVRDRLGESTQPRAPPASF